MTVNQTILAGSIVQFQKGCFAAFKLKLMQQELLFINKNLLKQLHSFQKATSLGHTQQTFPKLSVNPLNFLPKNNFLYKISQCLHNYMMPSHLSHLQGLVQHPKLNITNRPPHTEHIPMVPCVLNTSPLSPDMSRCHLYATSMCPYLEDSGSPW